MIIRYSYPEEKSMLKLLWKRRFKHDDFGSIDFFFDYCYKPEEVLVLIEDDRIISSCVIKNHSMMYQGKWIMVGFISGVFTVEGYEHKGYMTALLNVALKQQEHLTLFTFIQAYNPLLYKRFGFEEVFFNNTVQIKRSQLKPRSSSGIRMTIDYEGCLDIYSYFTTYFNGYFKRTANDFMLLQQAAKAENGNFFTLVNEEGRVDGYLKMVDHHKQAIVEEVVYRDSESLLKLLNYVLSTYGLIEVKTSSYEDLSLLIGGIEVKKEVSILARFNNPGLFERLFNVKVNHADSALKAFGKPLFNPEFY